MRSGWKKKTSKFINVLPPFEKPCSRCGCQMTYDNKYTFIYSLRDGKVCQHCSNKINGEKSSGNGGWMKEHNPMKRPEVVAKVSGKNNHRFGKRHSKDTLRKMRVSALLRIQNQINGCLSLGKNEKLLLDEQEKTDGVKIIRQWDTGLGYVVDGYCPETNTIYEVYEKYHNKQVQKDLERETEICTRLSCDFIIIWDE